MPHLVLDGWERPTRWTEGLGPSVHRWGRAVLKTSGWWRRHDDEALLVEGVVVEYSRPLHPVALVAAHHGQTIVRLWPAVTVERTPGRESSSPPTSPGSCGRTWVSGRAAGTDRAPEPSQPAWGERRRRQVEATVSQMMRRSSARLQFSM